jgi:hypothetical protein
LRGVVANEFVFFSDWNDERRMRLHVRVLLTTNGNGA